MAQASASVAPLLPPQDPPSTLDDGGAGGSSGPPPSNGDDRWDGGAGGSGGESPSHPFSFLLRGLRGRLAADPYFGHKLLVECGLDAIIIVGVNYSVRRERFFPEVEFTFCQLAISLLSDFALVYLLAPSTLRSAAAGGSLRARIAAFPAHVFQRAAPGAPFSLPARAATFLIKGVQYGGVGFAMGCLGAATVQGLVRLRERVDPDFESPATVQSIRGTGGAWSGFMATSSNVRYNLVNGLEDALYRRSARAGKLGSVALRLMNNWAGAAQWVLVTEYLDLEVPWKPAGQRKKERKGRRRGPKGAAA